MGSPQSLLLSLVLKCTWQNWGCGEVPACVPRTSHVSPALCVPALMSFPGDPGRVGLLPPARSSEMKRLVFLPHLPMSGAL